MLWDHKHFSIQKDMEKYVIWKYVFWNFFLVLLFQLMAHITMDNSYTFFISFFVGYMRMTFCSKYENKKHMGVNLHWLLHCLLWTPLLNTQGNVYFWPCTELCITIKFTFVYRKTPHEKYMGLGRETYQATQWFSSRHLNCRE